MGAADAEKGNTDVGGNFPWKMNVYMVFCWLFAACGGLMFGYDIGVSGGVTAMDDFLIKFFKDVYQKKLRAKENNYCKYDSQPLQAFTSSLYIAACISSFVASKACKKYGRKPTIMAASIAFLFGVGLSSAAQNILMLIFGRICLGIGVGFGNEAVPIFLSEVAPVQHRGAVNIMFQLLVTIGILLANVANYGTSAWHPYGYRVSLGIAGVPALLLLIGSCVITETPTSLMERGEENKAFETLKKVRGVSNVEDEFKQLKSACETARQVESNSDNKLWKRSSYPPLIIGILMQIFQQFTGINAIMFYAPVLFQTIGFKNDASLLSSVITGIVNVLSTLVAVFAVDRIGRRKLLSIACFVMFVSQVVIGAILLSSLTATESLSKFLAVVVVLFVCFFVFAFAWSWGPLGWLIPSETFPMEIRTQGFAVSVTSNMLCTAIIAQGFLSMMCHMHAFIFFFFAVWILAMWAFVWKLLPETKNVPIDLMVEDVWKKHPIWSRFMN